MIVKQIHEIIIQNSNKNNDFLLFDLEGILFLFSTVTHNQISSAPISSMFLGFRVDLYPSTFWNCWAHKSICLFYLKCLSKSNHVIKYIFYSYSQEISRITKKVSVLLLDKLSEEPTIFYLPAWSKTLIIKIIYSIL